jgi:hypothetical protein
MWRPALLGTAVALVVVPLYLWLGGPQGTQGLAGAVIPLYEWLDGLAGAEVPARAVRVVHEWLDGLHGARGLALAGVLGMSGYTLLTLGLLRWLHGGPPLGLLLETAGRALVVAVPAGLAAIWATGLAEAALARLLLGGSAFAIIAIPGTWLLGDEAMREALGRLLGRLRRRRT